MSPLGNRLPQMRLICVINANLSGLRDSTKVYRDDQGEQYWKIRFKVAVMFGGTQLRARLIWKENVSPNEHILHRHVIDTPFLGKYS